MAREISENNIEWYSGDKTVTLSFTQQRFVNKIKKYAKSNSDVEIVAENADGSICAHIPVSWIKIYPPKKGHVFTEEERKVAAERMRAAQALRHK